MVHPAYNIVKLHVAYEYVREVLHSVWSDISPKECECLGELEAGTGERLQEYGMSHTHQHTLEA